MAATPHDADAERARTRAVRAARLALGALGLGLAVSALWWPWMEKKDLETGEILTRWWAWDILVLDPFLVIGIVGLAARIVLDPLASGPRLVRRALVACAVVCGLLVSGVVVAGVADQDDWGMSFWRAVVVVVALGAAVWLSIARSRLVVPVCGVAGVLLAFAVYPAVETVSYTDALSAEPAEGPALASIGFLVLLVAAPWRTPSLTT